MLPKLGRGLPAGPSHLLRPFTQHMTRTSMASHIFITSGYLNDIFALGGLRLQACYLCLVTCQFSLMQHQYVGSPTSVSRSMTIQCVMPLISSSVEGWCRYPR